MMSNRQKAGLFPNVFGQSSGDILNSPPPELSTSFGVSLVYYAPDLLPLTLKNTLHCNPIGVACIYIYIYIYYIYIYIHTLLFIFYIFNANPPPPRNHRDVPR